MLWTPRQRPNAPEQESNAPLLVAVYNNDMGTGATESTSSQPTKRQPARITKVIKSFVLEMLIVNPRLKA